MVTMSCGLTLQICLTIALSFHCRHWKFGFVNGQVSLAWSIALRTQELYIHHLSWKKGGGKRELVAAPWTSYRQFSHVLWLKAHNHWLLRACLIGGKRKLPHPTCQVRLGLPSVISFQGVCSSLTLCTLVIRVLCQVLEPTAFLVHPVLEPLQKMLLLPTQVRQTAHGNSSELCRRTRPYHRSKTFLHLLLILSPSLLLSKSSASFQVKSLLTHSSSKSAMITRSSASRSSRGLQSRMRDNASSTMMKSSGLSTKALVNTDLRGYPPDIFLICPQKDTLWGTH